ncbi:sugar-binding transcriptional regulator [Caproiciproducens galactitolivorans]|uniref:Winged helix-turn-helix transcriptional regulator n=1 Tax=Caproiciproducens galactitolivorans TaxID=642589 RepID=A0ABT4BW47_9FIRM|nr:sugar-binding domain-containing protein [Caproiciproducens galactitolivorans]MCY1715117.1 winged helix-turn-helix transcriptional regulator [Caproiciproducens galactitolivorans]
MDKKVDLLVRVSELYYEQGLNQSAIADILGTSRPTVSRLLDEAKEDGVVEVIVHSPIKKDPQLSHRLRVNLGLREAIVVSGNYDYEKGLSRCCEAANQLFSTIIENNKTVGITWGSALKILCDLIEPKDYYNVNVVQMVGCLATGNPNLDGLELAFRMAKKLGGTYSNIYAPIYVESEVVYSYLVAEPQIEATLKRAMHTDIILTGIGSLDSNTTLQKAGYLTDRDRIDLIGRGAVGHLLAHPFDKDGNEIPLIGRFAISAPLEAMRAAEWSIGISASEFKAEAVLAAVRGGFINTLVVDQKLANKVLELAQEEE